jgi:hypothetical protein
MIRIAAHLLAIMIASEPLAAQAQWRGPDRCDRQDGRSGGQHGGKVLSMEQAVAILALRTPGRLLDLSRDHKSAQLVRR